MPFSTSRQAAQHKHLIDWANQLAQQSAPEVPPTVTPAAPFEPDNPEAPPQVLSQEARKAHLLPAAGQRTTVKRGAPAAAPLESSADPFDPEAFNRRYAPAKPPAKDQPSP